MKCSETPCPSTTSSTTIRASTGLELTQGLCGERRVTEHLSHSTAHEALTLSKKQKFSFFLRLRILRLHYKYQQLNASSFLNRALL